ncbi:peptidyl-Lys metalloendopeptidase [Cylindrobasidium torrendii FP15055 ss-10]|uniref:Peptidyl-Lys metalloendopeptidase n=1 Tax=Cylindrobasidium torrendii FP15055 ss-10 TaxID=1314674 RepID=A0A0D7BTX3_9AGAR|nr:peptidyl-Lys metalloendopeptidase [Cylindrobasidium torrendii FP15055 ss-10]
MFSSSMRSTLIALTASAVTASASGLTLSVAGSDATDASKFVVSAKLTNNGKETLKLLNEPNSLLSKFATNSFGISNAAGKSPAFNGVKVKFSPELAAKSNDDSLFTIIEPGKSVTIDHNLGSAYNFTSTGEDAYTVQPRTVFTLVDADGKVSSIKADVEEAASKVTAKLSGVLSVARKTGHSKRAYEGCSDDQQSTLVEAAKAAQGLAEESSSYLTDNTASTDRYASWFGEYTDDRHSTVSEHFSKMLDHPYADYTFDCSTCDEPSTYAYVYPDDDTTIYLCEVFWSTTTTGTDSRAGTLIHESSHFNSIGGTDDHVYGQDGAGDLASSDPDTAIDNADNHEYFAENTPAQD